MPEWSLGRLMKPFPLHPLSALAGAGLLGLGLLAAGAVQVQRIPTNRGPLHAAGVPAPKEMVVIKEGTPLVVPAGKLLAVTCLGGTYDNVQATLRVDGQDEFASVARLP
jgi:hypothetical protein